MFPWRVGLKLSKMAWTEVTPPFSATILSLPKLESEVVKCSKKRSHKPASPEPKVECCLLRGDFFGSGRRGAFLQRQNGSWSHDGGWRLLQNVTTDTITEWRRGGAWRWLNKGYGCWCWVWWRQRCIHQRHGKGGRAASTAGADESGGTCHHGEERYNKNKGAVHVGLHILMMMLSRSWMVTNCVINYQQYLISYRIHFFLLTPVETGESPVKKVEGIGWHHHKKKIGARGGRWDRLPPTVPSTIWCVWW